MIDWHIWEWKENGIVLSKTSVHKKWNVVSRLVREQVRSYLEEKRVTEGLVYLGFDKEILK